MIFKKFPWKTANNKNLLGGHVKLFYRDCYDYYCVLRSPINHVVSEGWGVSKMTISLHKLYLVKQKVTIKGRGSQKYPKNGHVVYG